MSEADRPITEELQPPTEAPPAAPTPKARAVRTEAQKEALARAREAANKTRQENAELRRKQAEIDRATLARAKQDEAERINREFEAISRASAPPQDEEEEEEEEAVAATPPPKPPRKRKPARRVIVTEASSASESENEEVEVVLPRARKQPSAEQLSYQRSMSRMFSYY